jgi:hypothetical protein
MNDLREIPQDIENTNSGLKPFANGIDKQAASERTDGYEFWDSPEIEIPNLGRFHAFIGVPRSHESIEAFLRHGEKESYILGNNGVIKTGNSEEALRDFGDLIISISPHSEMRDELMSRDAYFQGTVPRVDTDVIVWLGEQKLRGKLRDILHEDVISEYVLEGTDDDPKPVFIPLNEELLKEIRISFEARSEPSAVEN